MAKVSRHLTKALALLLLIISLPGCWQNRPVDERALVFTLGFENGPKNDPLAMIAQYPTSSSLLDYTAHKSIPSKPAPVDDIPAEGKTLAECFSDAQSKVDRDLYLGQIQLVDFATDLKPVMFERTLAALNRIGTMDMTPYVFVSKAPIDTMMEAKTNRAQFPTLYYVTLASCKHCQPVDLAVHFWQLSEDAATPGVDAFLPYVTVSSTKNVVINQVALYRHLRYVTTLTPSETDAFGILKGLARKLSLSMPQVQASLREIHGTSQMSVYKAHGKVHAVFHVSLLATLGSVASITETARQNSVIAHEASAILAKRCLAVLKQTQKDDVDPWGVGRMLDWQHPHIYAQYAHWHQEYPKVVMTVHVHVKLYKLGDLK